MRNRYRGLLAGGLGVLALLIAGCGSETGLLTGNQASRLQNQLSQIASALSAGHCSGVRTGTQNLVSAVASLPASVNGNLRQALDQEASQVSTLAVQECRPASVTTPTTPTTTTTTPTTPTTTTTPPATTPTTTGTNGGSSGGGGLSGAAGGAGGTAGTSSLTGNGSGGGNGNG